MDAQAWLEAAAGAEARRGSPDEALEAAEKALRRALQANPTYAEAEAELGELCLRRARLASAQARTGPRDLSRGIEAADRALATNPGLARAHLIRARLLLLQARQGRGRSRESTAAEAEEAARRAAAINPLLVAAAGVVEGEAAALRDR